jgi:DNA-binding response OmpR family regulator
MDYDPEKLQTILVNLLSNAIKLTPSGGRIFVQIEEIEEKNEPWLSLQVQDTGTGIESEKLSHIFDRFYQADDSSTRQGGGTGIGLALVRELVLLLEGRVFASSPGRDAGMQGAVFTVLLPVRRHPDTTTPARPADFPDLPAPYMLPEDAPAQVPADESDKRPVVLIVEDHAEVADYVVSCLRDTYRTLLARNGRAGIEQALEYIPDLIVSDVMMPEKDGFEVCALLKNDERTSHIPIVLLTARAGVEDRISGLRRGADAYLAKPFHPEELRVVLANLLELRHRLQAKYSALGLRHLDSGSPDAQAPAIKNAEPDLEDAFLQKLRAVVESRLSQPDLSVEEISRMVGMSYPVVHRKVTALTGRSLTLYMRAVRLQQARILLADPALSIADVAYETGFNDPKFFSRVFSEEYGMSPSAFRKSLRI